MTVETIIIIIRIRQNSTKAHDTKNSTTINIDSNSNSE